MLKHSAGFKHQSVRDLAWAVSSPPLLSQPLSPCVWPDSQWYRQIYEDTLPWLNRVDSDPAELDELLAGQKDRRMGKYFETLWFYWLSHNPRYQIIANNLQMIVEGETLGEIDFIVYDKLTDQTMHWEVAVKFYLGVDDTRVMSNWHGPNLRDRLDLKVQHLMQKQSVFTRNDQVSRWLEQQGISIDQCTVILKGRLYYPWKKLVHMDQAHGLPKTLSPAICAHDHLFSPWFSQREFEQAFDDRQCFLPLINIGWMEKIPTHSAREYYTKSAIDEIVSNKIFRLPLQLQLQDPRHCYDRAFITDDGWPTIVA